MPGFKIFRDKGIQEGFFKDHLNQFLSSKGLKADISAIQKKQYATGQKLQGNIDKNQDAATALEKYLTENDHRYISNEELVNVFPKYKNIFTTSGGKGIIDHGPLKTWRRKNKLSSELGRRTTQTKGEYNPLLTKGKKPINPELQKKMGSFDPEDPDRWRTDNVWSFNHIGGANNAGTGKEKALALKMFIDGSEKLVKENLREIQIMITTPSSMRYPADWDEIIMTKFKIDRIMVEYREFERTRLSEDDIKKKYGTSKVEILSSPIRGALTKIRELFTYVRTKNG